MLSHNVGDRSNPLQINSIYTFVVSLYMYIFYVQSYICILNECAVKIQHYL